jgi:DNA-binding NarL/FixJ family response regulator
VRVLVADDSAPARTALGRLVEATEGFVLVGSADSGEDALRLLRQVDPRFVLLDVRMPGLDGPETARLITMARPEVAVALVTAERLPPDHATTWGAVAFSKGEASPRRLKEVWAEAQAFRALALETRRAAQELREQAQALRAQARQQYGRSQNRQD